MLLKAKNCVRCGIKFTTGLDVHAEHKPKDKRAILEYVTWCGDCYPVRHEAIPDGYRPSPTGWIKLAVEYKVAEDNRERESHKVADGSELTAEGIATAKKIAEKTLAEKKKK